jgi:monoamine oxidase
MRTRWDGWTGAEQKEVSLRYWQSDITFGGPDAVLVNGYKGVYEHLSSIVRRDQGSEILLQQEVVSIALAEDKSSIAIETVAPSSSDDDRQTHNAAFVICTLPLGVLQTRPPVFSPPLPKRRLDATARIGMGMLNKVVLSYPTCFWPEQEPMLTFLPSKVSEAFMPILANGALFAQNYKPITGKNVLVFYCAADFGKEIEELSDEEIKVGLHSILQHHFGDQPDFPKAGPEHIIVTRWQSDPYSCGAYSYVRATPANSQEPYTPFDFSELARPLWGDRLLFAGEATDYAHNACVHGPLITGRREAARILAKVEELAMED